MQGRLLFLSSSDGAVTWKRHLNYSLLVPPLSIFWGSNLTSLDDWLFPATVSTLSNTETNTPLIELESGIQNHKLVYWGLWELAAAALCRKEVTLWILMSQSRWWNRSHWSRANLIWTPNNARPLITKGANWMIAKGRVLYWSAGLPPPPHRHHHHPLQLAFVHKLADKDEGKGRRLGEECGIR